MNMERRIVVCLDLQGGRVVKGEGFQALREMGDPCELAVRAAAGGADELFLLAIDATPSGPQHAKAPHSHGSPALEITRRIAREVGIPLTYGGGIRTVEDIARALDAGAARVAINSAAVASPRLVTDAAARFGDERIVVSIDARRVGTDERGGGKQCRDGGLERWAARDKRAMDPSLFQVYIRGGREPTGLEAGAWARACAERGAGALLVTSIDRDGRRDGFDLDLIHCVAAATDTPLIASGGAGNADHFLELFTLTSAAAGLGAGIFHDGVTTPAAIKSYLASAGIAVQNSGAIR